jgi:hypothetical protein
MENARNGQTVWNNAGTKWPIKVPENGASNDIWIINLITLNHEIIYQHMSSVGGA